MVVAMAELIDMLGLSKSWVVRLVKEPDFPEPLARLRAGQKPSLAPRSKKSSANASEFTA